METPKVENTVVDSRCEYETKSSLSVMLETHENKNDMPAVDVSVEVKVELALV